MTHRIDPEQAAANAARDALAATLPHRDDLGRADLEGRLPVLDDALAAAADRIIARLSEPRP